MIRILPDPTLHSSGTDPATRLDGDTLRTSQEMFEVLRSLGVQDASMVLPTFDEMPSAFLAGLGVPATKLQELRAKLVASLKGVPSSAEAVPFEMPPLGAFRPR